MKENKKKICVILGPTATGKSKLAVYIAKKINGEIISADSMQIYKEMNIATAKITEKEKENVAHHMMDFLDVEKEFSVAEYVKKARKVIDEIIKKNKSPILVGGTGLYINSLLHGFSFNENTVDEKLRENLNKEYELKGKEFIFQKLKKINPNLAEKLHKNNVKRVIRAIELSLLSNAEEINNIANKEENFNVLKIGLNFKDRENLYNAVNKRVDYMFENGLIYEAEKLLKNKKLSKTAMQAIGYKELEQYLNKKITLKEAAEKLKQSTRKFAKRQITWFKRDNEIKWFYWDCEDEIKIKEEILKLVKNFLKIDVN